MKRFIGFLILIIVLVAVSGCTQQATTPPVTTTVQTIAPTAAATAAETAAPALAETTNATPVATATAATNETTPAVNATVAVPETTTIVTAGMTPSTKITVIHIANNTFSPSPLMVLPGTRITWINDDSSIHSVKMIGAHSGKFNSGDIAPKVQWGYDFSQDEGTYEYADGYNMNVTGVIIVKKGDSLVGMVVTSTPYITSNATW